MSTLRSDRAKRRHARLRLVRLVILIFVIVILLIAAYFVWFRHNPGTAGLLHVFASIFPDRSSSLFSGFTAAEGTGSGDQMVSTGLLLWVSALQT